MIEYSCGVCGHSFESKTRRVGCPKCKKRKLKELEELKTKTLDFTHNFKQEGSIKRQPVKAGKMQFLDLSDIPKDKDDLKIKRALAKGKIDKAQRRDRVSNIKLTCKGCSKSIEINPALAVENFYCDNCISGRVR